MDDQREKWTSARSHGLLAVLCLVGLISFIDRQIITILIEPIKAEFKASDTAMGALAGIVFSGFYAAAAIPLARLADRLSRRNLIAASLAFWSLMTSFGAFASNYWMLAATRIGVAVGEAGATPASHSVIADLYPVNRRATAIGLLSAGQSIGIGAGVLLGGVLTAKFDWRTSFLIVGFPGLIVSLVLILFFREPPRGMSEALDEVRAQPSFFTTFAELWRIRTYRYLFLTVGFAGVAGYGVLAWGPSYLARIHGMPPGLIGIWFGGAVAGSLVLGNILGGWLADRLGARDLRYYMWIAGAGPLLAFVPGVVFAFASRWEVAIAALFAFMLVLTTQIPTCYMLAQTLVRPRMRAMAAVVVGLSSGVFGAGLGPLIVGRISDLLAPMLGLESLRYALLPALGCALLTALMAIIGARHVRADYDALHKGP